MRKILVWAAFVSLAACSAQSYLEESKDLIQLPFSVSYDATAEGVNLLWSANWDNTMFQVFRGTNENELVLYVSNLYQTNWIDTEATPGVDYFYSVKAFTQKGRNVGYTPALKGYRSYQDYALMHAPTEFLADKDKYGDRIALYWFGQKESRFQIYRSALESGTYQKIAEVGGVKYTDTNVSPGEKWYYKIASIGKDFTILNAPRVIDTLRERYYNGSDTAGAPDISTATFQMGSTANCPVGVTASDTTSAAARTGTIKVSWIWDGKADYYKIYRSATEDGDYELIAPYSRTTTNIQGVSTGVYSDKGMPSLAGILVGGVYAYPKYYYKVSVVKNNQESSLSAVAVGSALDAKDVLPAPENVSVKIHTASVEGFAPESKFPVLSAGKYSLDITWDKLPTGITDGYFFNVIASNTVSGAVSTVNALPISATNPYYLAPNPDFNEEVLYSVVAVNTSKGDLPGIGGNALYKSATPLPPAFDSASKLKRLETTNEIATNAPTYTQYQTGSGDRYTYPGLGAVSKVWITTAKVGDVELQFTPVAANMQQSYNVYRRKKTEGNSELWALVTNVAHSNDIDAPESAVKQTIDDANFTAEQYKGSGSAASITNFYPVYEYRIAALNDGKESAPTLLAKEGQAINPADILPAPDYLSVPFHYAKGMGLAFWSRGWTVTSNSAPYTTGFEQIAGKSGSFTETQRVFITWGAVTAPSGVTFDYRFRHVRSAFVAANTTQYAQEDYLKPASWYTHGGIGTQTWVKLNNETANGSMTYMYDVIDSGIAGGFTASYTAGSAYFAVSATNKNAAGLDGNTIGVFFEEPADDPYGTPLGAPTGISAALDTTVYPYQLKVSWNKVSGATGYNVLLKTDTDEYVRVDGAGNPTTVGDTNSYSFAPPTEFILGTSYTYYIQPIKGSAPGNAGFVSYTHDTPYQPSLVAVSTNKVAYATNITASTNGETWIENEAFTDGANAFSLAKRNVGAVIKAWTVSAAGGLIDLQLSYGRAGTLPDSYKVYRGPGINGPWTSAATVPVNKSAPLGATAYTDTVGAGKYYYKISAVYNSQSGSETEGSESNVGVSLDTAKLSPPPSYLSVPFHWAFGAAGYTGTIKTIAESPIGIAQVAGRSGGGQTLWLTWNAVSSGQNPVYTVRVSQGSDDVLSSADVLLLGSTETKVQVDNGAGTGKTALYSPVETSRTAYIQDKSAFDVTAVNTFTDALGNTVTIAGGSKGIVFYESPDPYTEGELAATASVTAALDKESYIGAGNYNLNITWPRVEGAGAYTLIRRQGGADTVLLTTNAPASNPSGFTYAYDASGLGLGQNYDFVVVSTNLSPVKKGGSNSTSYAHNTPRPVKVTSITTNDATELTNEQAVSENLTVYWGSSSMQTGKTIRRWHITQPNKGIISLKWAKLAPAEAPDYYKVYRTLVSNSPGLMNNHDPASWANVGTIHTTANGGVLDFRDDTSITMSPGQRQGGGAAFAYPVYYYRVTAVKLAGGMEYESLPSFYTNGASTGIAAGGSAIDPTDIYEAPHYVNVPFDYSKRTGWGDNNIVKGAASPEGIELFGTRKRGALNYPPNPLWVVWGLSKDASGVTNTAARFWVRKHFRATQGWPGWGGFTLSDQNYSGNNSTTTYVATRENPTENRIIEYSNSDTMSGGNPVSTLYDISTRTGGLALDVTSVNPNVRLNGLPLKGESRGLWYHQTSY